jgi:hypothetical protein
VSYSLSHIGLAHFLIMGFIHPAQPTGKGHHVKLKVHHGLQVLDPVHSPPDFVRAETFTHYVFDVFLEFHLVTSHGSQSS